MGLEELKNELQAINSQEFAEAIGRVLVKSLDMDESNNQVEALEREYPNLVMAAQVTKVHAEYCGASPEGTAAIMTGAIAAILAFKEMIDTRDLNSIPVSE